MTIADWLDRYADSHRHPVNKTIHRIAVPVIALDVLGLLAALPAGTLVPGVSLVAGGVAAVALLYYARLSPALAIGMALLVVPALALLGAAHVATGAAFVPLLLAVFVVAWVAQFVGHSIEGARPSFFDDLQFLLIGPLWLLADAYRRLGFAAAIA